MLIARENTGEKELLLDCSTIAYMFDEQYYFTFYTPIQTVNKYITIDSHNHIPIVGHESVKFWTKLPARILTVIFQNVIYISGFGANLVSLGALYREDVNVWSAGLGLVIEVRDKELFYAMLAGWDSTLYQIQAKDIISYKAFIATGNIIYL